MDERVKEFLKDDRDWIANLWQKEKNILGRAKRLEESLQSTVLVHTHPVGKEMLKTAEMIIDRQEQKIEIIEDRLDEYDELLGDVDG